MFTTYDGRFAVSAIPRRLRSFVGRLGCLGRLGFCGPLAWALVVGACEVAWHTC